MRQQSPSVDQHITRKLSYWGIYTPSVVLILIGIAYIPLKLSVFDLLLFLPRISQVTDLKQNHSFEVSPQGSLFYVAAITIVLYITWYEIINRRAEIMNSDIAELEENIKEQMNEDNSDILIKNCVSMMDQVDFEYKYLKATCAHNNQTPGIKNGEVEWALGETTSEDELMELSKTSSKPVQAVSQT